MEALSYADSERNGRDAFIGVRWDSGNPEDTVLIYGDALPGVTVGFLDMKLEDLPDIVAKNRDTPMYLITRNGQRADLDRWLTLRAQFRKPMGSESVDVYQFQP